MAVRVARPVKQIPEFAVWGEPPYVPGWTVVSPHTGATDMARMIGIPLAGHEGLGQAQVPADYMSIVRDVQSFYTSYQPMIDFLGAHPVLTVTMIVAAIVAGGAAGGYIGGVLQAEYAAKGRK